jgi:hypothetical protein
MRGLSNYEFNICLYEALQAVGDDTLTAFVTTTHNLNLDVKRVPPGVSAANYKRFIYELDYILVWKSCRDFHMKEHKINDTTVRTKVSLDDIRSLDGVRDLAIVVYHLSGYVKEVPQQVASFREHGEGTPAGITPLPSEHQAGNVS